MGVVQRGLQGFCRALARGRLPLAAGLLVSSLAQGQSLLESYDLARRHDPKFKASQADAAANSTALDQARAGFLPSARFEYEKMESRQRILRSNNPIFGAGLSTFPTDNRTLSIAQAIFRKDVIERYQQAKAVVRQAGYTLLAAEQELLLRTTAAYLAVLAATDSLALSQAERTAVGKALDLARERLKGGLGTITALHDATARHAVTLAREVEAQNKLNDAKQGLKEIIDRTVKTPQTLRADFALQRPDPADIERWVAVALDQNLTVKARTEAVEVAMQEIERQRAGHWPSLNLLVNHNRKDSGSTLFGGGSLVETTDVMLRLSVPIFEGGLTSAVTQEAVHKHQRSKEELEMERRGVERQVRAAYEGTVSGVTLIDALRQSVVSQQAALDAKEEGYKAGLLTLLPVLDAQRDLFLARRDYAQSRYDYLLNSLKLKLAAGTLSEDDLRRIDATLQ